MIFLYFSPFIVWFSYGIEQLLRSLQPLPAGPSARRIQIKSDSTIASDPECELKQIEFCNQQSLCEWIIWPTGDTFRVKKLFENLPEDALSSLV